MSSLPDTLADATVSIEQVSLRIEDAFAMVGGQLGQGHATFQELNEGLTALSRELSGAEIGAASSALLDIAGRLNGLAQALSAESALLGQIGTAAAEAAVLLEPLFKHIQMVTIIARSARIEAASFEGHRDDFLAFTREAYDLGRAVQRSIEACARDQELLSAAVATALERHKDFELCYSPQLGAAGAELMSAHAGMTQQRDSGIHLVDVAGVSTRKVAEAVGTAIISLQAGDSTRQRLEHICAALRQTAGVAPGLVPGLPDADGTEQLVLALQAAQLKDAQREFGRDIGQIVRTLSAILGDADAVIGRARSLYGKDGDSSSLLARVRQALAHASGLIGTCEHAGRSVDDALTIVEDTVAKFRQAIAGLSEAVIDITLIGMNAGLRAGHLGSKGNAFVVIANELKATADQVAGGASRLKPVLDRIEQEANELRELRRHVDPTQLAAIEPVILKALQEVEAGNGRLGTMMERLAREGVEFEALINAAQSMMAGLGEAAAPLPSAARRLELDGMRWQGTLPAPHEEAALDELYVRYTMERERDVHRMFLQRFGLTAKAAAAVKQVDGGDDVLLF